MSGYQELLLSVHVLGAVVWVGGSVFMLALGYHLRSRGLQARIDYARWIDRLAPPLIAPASIAVIVAGPLLADDLGYDLGAPWLTVGFVGWTISFLLGVAFYPREGKRRERLIEQHGIEHEAVAASLSRMLRVATIDTLIVVLVVLDMTTKPGV